MARSKRERAQEESYFDKLNREKLKALLTTKSQKVEGEQQPEDGQPADDKEASE